MEKSLVTYRASFNRGHYQICPS